MEKLFDNFGVARADQDAVLGAISRQMEKHGTDFAARDCRYRYGYLPCGVEVIQTYRETMNGYQLVHAGLHLMGNEFWLVKVGGFHMAQNKDPLGCTVLGGGYRTGSPCPVQLVMNRCHIGIGNKDILYLQMVAFAQSVVLAPPREVAPDSYLLVLDNDGILKQAPPGSDARLTLYGQVTVKELQFRKLSLEGKIHATFATFIVEFDEGRIPMVVGAHQCDFSQLHEGSQLNVYFTFAGDVALEEYCTRLDPSQEAILLDEDSSRWVFDWDRVSGIGRRQLAAYLSSEGYLATQIARNSGEPDSDFMMEKDGRKFAIYLEVGVLPHVPFLSSFFARKALSLSHTNGVFPIYASISYKGKDLYNYHEHPEGDGPIGDFEGLQCMNAGFDHLLPAKKRLVFGIQVLQNWLNAHEYEIGYIIKFETSYFHIAARKEGKYVNFRIEVEMRGTPFNPPEAPSLSLMEKCRKNHRAECRVVRIVVDPIRELELTGDLHNPLGSKFWRWDEMQIHSLVGAKITKVIIPGEFRN